MAAQKRRDHGTRTYGDRLDAFADVRAAGISVCCGGIVGVGEAVQAMCFLAGANSIFYGDKLLVTGNPDVEADTALLKKLGLNGLGAAV